jgi:transposase
MRVEAMPKKKYSDEFKADAVALYETHPDMSYSQVATDLGVSRGAIKTWVHQARKAAGAIHAAEIREKPDVFRNTDLSLELAGADGDKP